MKCVPLTTLILTAISSMPSFGTSSNEVLSVIIGDGYVLEELATGNVLEVAASSIAVDEEGVATADDPGEGEFPVLPGPEASTNAVAVALLEMLRISDIDHFDQIDDSGIPYATEPVVPTWTWDGFLGNDETNGWTRIAKKACFDWYLGYIATNRCEFTDLQTNLACIAITQCEDLNYTNAWGSLEGMARNPVAPHRLWSGRLAIAYAPEGPAMLSLGLDATTNSLHLTEDERSSVAEAFAARLCECQSAASLLAVKALYGIRGREVRASMTFDRLFVARIEGYASSSNRLSTASDYLSQQALTGLQRDYFGAITNQLQNAAQPLPEVETLRDL